MLKGTGKGVAGENIREMKKKGLSERDAVMASMKRSKKEKKMDHPLASSPSHEDYPYGLRLDLDHETMGKLGVKKMPKAGATFKIKAHAKVHRAEESSSTDGGKRRNMALQITKMKMHCDDEKDE